MNDCMDVDPPANNLNLSLTMDERLGNSRPSVQIKTNPISEDYEISSKVLGLGINGKVVECFNKQTGKKHALKVK